MQQSRDSLSDKFADREITAMSTALWWFGAAALLRSKGLMFLLLHAVPSVDGAEEFVLRARLDEANHRIRVLTSELHSAWDEIEGLKRKLARWMPEGRGSMLVAQAAEPILSGECKLCRTLLFTCTCSTVRA